MPKEVKPAIEELEAFFRQSSGKIQDALMLIVRAKMSGDGVREQFALQEFAKTITGAKKVSDLLGRRRLWLEVEAKRRAIEKGQPIRVQYGAVRADPLPNIPFEEAIDDILSRIPDGEAHGERIAELYDEQHGFALARTSSQKLTQQIQKQIGKSLGEVTDVNLQTRIIQGMGDFTRAYAETVYRTNVNTAFNNGRFEMASDPDVVDVVPAMEYRAVGDVDTRDNHQAAHGFVARTNDPIWRFMKPPFGYNCRCVVRTVDRFELERRGLLGPDGQVPLRTSPPPGAFPDPGFKAQAATEGFI